MDEFIKALEEDREYDFIANNGFTKFRYTNEPQDVLMEYIALIHDADNWTELKEELLSNLRKIAETD